MSETITSSSRIDGAKLSHRGKAHTVSKESIATIRANIDKATSNPTKNIPGFVAHVVNRSGDEIFSHASGKRGHDTEEPMTMETVFWIASCTKMVTGIACMQLVEQGVLKLDDPDLVDKLCPEIKDVKILKGFEKDKPILVEKNNRITLRMLLSHTAGFGYSFFSPLIRNYGYPAGIDEFSGSIKEFQTPLLFEPGTNWNYGTNIDWAGFMVERSTNMSLNDYIQQNIIKPLGITNMSFFPDQEMISRLAHMHYRDPLGNISTREHLLRAPLTSKYGSQEQRDIANSGGAGIFAEPKEYTKIIATLLNDGTSPTTGAQLLKPETVEAMFENQIPDMPNFARVPIEDANPQLTNKIPEMYPQPHDQPQGWGLTFLLTIEEGATGRGKNTGHWAGLPNLFWWCDRTKGVGGMVASQILPFNDPQVGQLWGETEAMVYAG